MVPSKRRQNLRQNGAEHYWEAATVEGIDTTGERIDNRDVRGFC